jgi:RNA polymerase sigma-70 factor (ECF subfamily)
MPDIDESQLIDASLQGDSAAFGQIVQVHQQRLFNAMVLFCGNAAEAEDVVQDAFVQAYVNLAKFQQNSQFYTWLYRIALNTAISRKRRKRVESSVDKNREQAGLEPIDEGDAPGDQMMREEQAVQVHQALAMLSEEHRSILVLREMDGCDYEQIAEILDINVGTVRSRLHRARMQMRERLQELEGPL